MSAAAISSQIQGVLAEDFTTDRVENVVRQVEGLGQRERFELVVSNEEWGRLILARLPHECAFRLLSALTDVRPPPAAREQFYASFDCQGLCEGCAEQLRAQWGPQHALYVRRCIRNLARNPVFRLRCSSAVSLLAASLKESEAQSKEGLDIAAASAAALCNICCDNAFKAEGVRLGVVADLLKCLKLSPTVAAAEDFVACVGVLCASFPPGMEALFTSGDGGVLLACLCDRGSSALQTMAAEVLSDLCSCSKSFTSWLVGDTELLSEHMAHLLSVDGDPEVLNASLKLVKRLAEADGFVKAAQKGSTLSALQQIAELPEVCPPATAEFTFERRPPTKQEEARAILGKVLFF